MVTEKSAVSEKAEQFGTWCPSHCRKITIETGDVHHLSECQKTKKKSKSLDSFFAFWAFWHLDSWN
jgi:hypothetical protein